jgi:hypothetical protein
MNTILSEKEQRFEKFVDLINAEPETLKSIYLLMNFIQQEREFNYHKDINGKSIFFVHYQHGGDNKINILADSTEEALDIFTREYINKYDLMDKGCVYGITSQGRVI